MSRNKAFARFFISLLLYGHHRGFNDFMKLISIIFNLMAS